jgi:hypothetical protein
MNKNYITVKRKMMRPAMLQHLPVSPPPPHGMVGSNIYLSVFLVAFTFHVILD